MLTISEPALLTRIAKLYRPDMTDQELYEATRGVWKLAERRQEVQYALSVAKGIVREVYAVDTWQPGGTAHYETRSIEEFNGPGRWEFSGKVAPPEIRAKYVGKSVAHYFKRGNSNGVNYVNVP